MTPASHIGKPRMDFRMGIDKATEKPIDYELQREEICTPA